MGGKNTKLAFWKRGGIPHQGVSGLSGVRQSSLTTTQMAGALAEDMRRRVANTRWLCQVPNII